MKLESLHIIKTLQENGHIAVWAGGCVRDSLLGKEPKDWDVATSATPEDVKTLFPNVIPVGASFGVSVVVINGHEIEVATLRGDGSYSDGRRPDTVTFDVGLQEDAARRDFTINAMFHDPITDRLIDFFEGQKDLDCKILRAVGNPFDRINEDRLRMLRAIRFTCRLGLKPDTDLLAAIILTAPELPSVSWERISMELFNILPHKRSIEWLDSLGILPIILPEVARLASVPGDPVHHPEGDVLVHSIGTANMLRDMGCDPFMILVGLIHDVGKFVSHQCWTDDEGRERHSHKGHDFTGSEIAEELLRRLKLPNEQVSKGSELVRQHMKAHYARDMKKSTLLAFLRNPYINDIVALQHADASNSAYAGKTLLSFYQENLANLAPEISSKPLLSGKHLIEKGLTPGPIFSEILNDLRIAQDEGVVKNEQEAWDFVDNWILLNISGGF